MRTTPDDELAITVQSPDQFIWQGKASAVSSVNSLGPFDILPDHARMITLIDGAPIVVITNEGEKAFSFSKAVIFVRDNVVSIYADLATPEVSDESK